MELEWISQLSPETARVLIQPAMLETFFSTIFSGILMLVLIGLLLKVFDIVTKNRSSMDHRKLITDMYVAGTIRKMAKEEGVDLNTEFKIFKKALSKDKNAGLELDDAIEKNLRDRQTAKNDKDIEKLSGEDKDAPEYK